jgi:lysophospholipase L1-like esterase
MHARYNDVVRAVAAERDVPLVDLAGLYARNAAAHTFTAADAIHPTDEGHALEAQALHAQLRRIGAVGPQARFELQRAQAR